MADNSTPAWLKDYTVSSDPPWLKDYVPNKLSPEAKAIGSPEEIAKYGGRVAAESLPFAGSLVPGGIIPAALGALSGTFGKTLLKSYFPKIFGEAPQTVGDLAKTATIDQLNNVGVPAAVSGLSRVATGIAQTGPGIAIASKLSNFPAVREGLIKNITNKAMKRVYPETGIIEQGASNAEQAIQANPRLVFNNPQANKLFTLQQEYQDALATGNQIARTQKYRDITNTVLDDVTSVGNAKLVAGEDFTNDLAMNQLLSKQLHPEKGTLNAANILHELTVGGKSQIYQEAMKPASYASFKSMMQTAVDLEKEHAVDRVVSYSKGRLIWNIGSVGFGTGLGHLLGSSGLGAAAGVGLSTAPLVINKALGRIASDPAKAQLIELAMKTPLGSAKAGPIQEALMQILVRESQAAADLASTPER